MKTNYVYQGCVMKVERRDRLVRGFKTADGETKYEYEDLGWFLVIDCFPLIAFPLGKERPDPMPKPGSAIEVVLRFPGEPPARIADTAPAPQPPQLSEVSLHGHKQ